jgi:protein-L-isoaspartate(D-aspartate) O-methyltransferase
MTYDDPPRARHLRKMLVEHWIEVGDLQSMRLRDALLRVPRHLFVPHVSLEEAYADRPAPIGHGQTISQPTVVAMMTQGLELRGHERFRPHHRDRSGAGHPACLVRPTR